MDRLTRCPVCSSITTMFYPQYQCCVVCMSTSLRIKLKKEESKMGTVPVKPKKDFKRPQLMEDENV